MEANMGSRNSISKARVPEGRRHVSFGQIPGSRENTPLILAGIKTSFIRYFRSCFAAQSSLDLSYHIYETLLLLRSQE